MWNLNDARHDAWKASGLPARHIKQFVEGVDDSSGWGWCRDGITPRLGEGFLLALIGQRGGGKTQIGAALIRAACGKIESATLSRAFWPRYTRIMDLLMRLRSMYSKGGEMDESEMIAEYTSPKLLVIDDAHERGETAWENRMLPHILDVRYGGMNDTLLISNQSQEEFERSIGASIYSRLVETGGVIVCDWGSFREGGA